MTNLAQPSPLPGWAPPRFEDFADACDAVLAHLRATLPLETWVVARVDGDDAVVLAALDDAGRVAPGDTFSWTASISARMVAGRGPRAVPSIAAHEPYRAAPAARDHEVAAYLGVPLLRADGTLFGVVAGTSRQPADASIAEAVALVELLARLLSAQLSAELRESEAARSVDRARATEMHDGVTGVGNATYWDRILVSEESRCRRYGDRAAVLVVELADYDALLASEGPDAADVILRRAARVLRTECRQEDVVARLGGATFAVLSVGADEDGAAALAARIEDQLAATGTLASVGVAARDARTGLHAAWNAAATGLPAEERRPA